MRNIEEVYYGKEIIPTSNSNLDLIEALNWYNYNVSTDQAKRYAINYYKTIDPKINLESIHENYFSTIGFVCRIKSHGVVLSEKQEQFLSDKFKYIISLLHKEPKVKREINIQERIQDNANQFISHIDGVIDEFIKNRKVEFDCYNYLISNSVKSLHCKYISEYYSNLLDELTSALEDKEILEYYSGYTKAELKNYIKLITSILDDCDRISHKTKIQKKPRKKKEKSVDKVLEKLQYKKEDNEYKLTSIDPKNILGANSLLVFDVKYRKIGIYYSASDKGFSVKGTTLQNFDSDRSIVKMVRKPKEFLDLLLKGTKKSIERGIIDLKTTENKLTGRINSEVILLKAFK